MWGQRLIRLALLIVGVGVILLVIKSLGPKLESQSSIERPKVSFEKVERQILGTAEQKILSNYQGEPLVEPAENIESQTQALIQMIKDLPADQLEAVKSQIYKEFCQE